MVCQHNILTITYVRCIMAAMLISYSFRKCNSYLTNDKQQWNDINFKRFIYTSTNLTKTLCYVTRMLILDPEVIKYKKAKAFNDNIYYMNMSLNNWLIWIHDVLVRSLMHDNRLRRLRTNIPPLLFCNVLRLRRLPEADGFVVGRCMPGRPQDAMTDFRRLLLAHQHL